MKRFEPLRLGVSAPGQHYPKQCPTPPGELGEPLGIREVARLIGCSVWCVRQRQIPAGLPHFRTGPSGRLIFYRDQVVCWIFEQQKKRGLG